MKVKFSVSTKYIGSEVEEIFEFDDDMTDSELIEELDEWVCNNISSDFERLEEVE